MNGFYNRSNATTLRLCIIFRHCKDIDKYLKAKSFVSFFISPYFFYILHTLN